jgi:hypothetical protein
MIPYFRRKTVSISGLLGTVVMLYCNNSSQMPLVPYVPEVTFAGFINGEYDSLTGNRTWPNTCRLAGDTVRIYCYSTMFTEADKIRHGELLRIDLLPDSAVGFQKRNVLFHLARYYDATESYTVNRGDTIDVSIRFESAIVSFAHSVGADVELNKIYVATPPVKNGRYLTITNGHLIGRVHRP